MVGGNDESMSSDRERVLRVRMMSKLLHKNKIKIKIDRKYSFTIYLDEHNQ